MRWLTVGWARLWRCSHGLCVAVCVMAGEVGNSRRLRGDPHLSVDGGRPHAGACCQAHGVAFVVLGPHTQARHGVLAYHRTRCIMCCSNACMTACVSDVHGHPARMISARPTPLRLRCSCSVTGTRCRVALVYSNNIQLSRLPGFLQPTCFTWNNIYFCSDVFDRSTGVSRSQPRSLALSSLVGGTSTLTQCERATSSCHVALRDLVCAVVCARGLCACLT